MWFLWDKLYYHLYIGGEQRTNIYKDVRAECNNNLWVKWVKGEDQDFIWVSFYLNMWLRKSTILCDVQFWELQLRCFLSRNIKKRKTL